MSKGLLERGNEYLLPGGVGKYGSDAFAALVDTEDWYDEKSGDVEAPTGWFGLAGRSIISHDSDGSVRRHRYGSRAEARAIFDALDSAYGSWLGDEGDE